MALHLTFYLYDKSPKKNNLHGLKENSHFLAPCHSGRKRKLSQSSSTVPKKKSRRSKCVHRHPFNNGPLVPTRCSVISAVHICTSCCLFLSSFERWKALDEALITTVQLYQRAIHFKLFFSSLSLFSFCCIIELSLHACRKSKGAKSRHDAIWDDLAMILHNPQILQVNARLSI